MPFSALATAVCLVVCHSGPADHFATFVEHLPPDSAIEIYASGPALKKLQERAIVVKHPFSIEALSPEEEEALATQIAKTCSAAKVVLTDVGHPFDIKVQKALARHASHVTRLAYYDNPEAYVPGGYSSIAFEVMQAAQGVLFANATLSETSLFQAPGKAIDLSHQKKVGVGYYPLQQAEKIAKKREKEKTLLRQALFAKRGLTDKGERVLVYLGGNNETYFSQALPAFLSLLEQGMKKSDFSHLVIVFQQHPGAKAKNTDGHLVQAWLHEHSQDPRAPRLFLSDLHSEEAQAVADAALYYQTSMGPQLVLAGIPTIQIGHETYEDVLVRNGLSTPVTTVDQLIQVIDTLGQKQQEISPQALLESLGIKKEWLHLLEMALFSSCANSTLP